jgi:hypothetical protein
VYGWGSGVVREETCSMSGRIFGFGALLVALLVMGMLAMRMGSSKIVQPPSTQLCQDVRAFTGTVRDIRAGTLPNDQAIVKLGEAQDALALDAQREQNPIAAAQVTAVASDVSDWRTASLAGDTAEEDMALNRALADVMAVRSC